MAKITIEIDGIPVKIEGDANEVIAMSKEILVGIVSGSRPMADREKTTALAIASAAASSIEADDAHSASGAENDGLQDVNHANLRLAVDELAIERYTEELLNILVEMNGQGNATKVIQELFIRIAPELTKRDRTETASGVPKWRTRVKWAREKLVRNGLVAKHSPRGVWQLTEQGWNEAPTTAKPRA